MRYLHTMVRVSDLEKSLAFYCGKLGLEECALHGGTERGATRWSFCRPCRWGPRAKTERAPLIELTYNWDPEDYGSARNFGHLAFEVDDIYALCQRPTRTTASPSTARPATATWPSSAPPTTSPSRSCRGAQPSPPLRALGLDAQLGTW